MSTPSKKINLNTLLTLSEKWANKTKLHKDIATKHEDWGMRLKLIQSEAQIIRTSLQSPDKDGGLLEKSMQGLQKKLKAMSKELQKKQTLFSKKRNEVREKLLDVVDKFSSSSKILYQAVKENCQKIEGDLKTSKAYLDEDAKRIEECGQLLKTIRENMDKDLLPENLESCAKTSEDLKTRLEQLNKATFSLQEMMLGSAQVLSFPQSNGTVAAQVSQSSVASQTASASQSAVAAASNATSTSTLNLQSASSSATLNLQSASTSQSATTAQPTSTTTSTSTATSASQASQSAQAAQALSNAKGIKSSLTLLRDNCSAHVKLLDLVTANLKRVYKDIDTKEEQVESKKEEKKELKTN